MRSIPPLRRARGEMLPLMDMIFLLLVVFIFMIVQMRPDFGIPVDLPDIGKSKAPSTSTDEKRLIVVSVTADGKTYVGDTEVPTDGVSAAVKADAGEDTAPDNISVILRGDEAIGYGHMVQLLDALRRSDLKRVVFDVEPGSTGGPGSK